MKLFRQLSVPQAMLLTLALDGARRRDMEATLGRHGYTRKLVHNSLLRLQDMGYMRQDDVSAPVSGNRRVRLWRCTTAGRHALLQMHSQAEWLLLMINADARNDWLKTLSG